MLRVVCLLLTLLLLCLAPVSQAGELEDFLREQLAIARVPGFAGGIVKRGALVYNFTHGVTDIRTQEPVSLDTIFIQASVSKTITTTAFLAALERVFGAVEPPLDRPVDSLFPLVNPNHPAANITLRHLLTHVSSINDLWPTFYRRIVRGDPGPVGAYLNDYLLPGGQFYRSRNFHQFPPQTAFDYCNHAIALVGHLVELLTGQEFDAFCAEAVYRPLGMASTSFFLRNLDAARIATCHDGATFLPELRPLPQYGIPDYPAGNLRSSLPDLARFLAAHMNDGVLGGVRILSAETVASLRRVQYPALANYQGLGFYYRDLEQLGLVRVGHSGGIFGARTELWYDLSGERVGVIMMANGDTAGEEGNAAWLAILARLFEEGKRMF